MKSALGIIMHIWYFLSFNFVKLGCYTFKNLFTSLIIALVNINGPQGSLRKCSKAVVWVKSVLKVNFIFSHATCITVLISNCEETSGGFEKAVKSNVPGYQPLQSQ